MGLQKSRDLTKETQLVSGRLSNCFCTSLYLLKALYGWHIFPKDAHRFPPSLCIPSRSGSSSLSSMPFTMIPFIWASHGAHFRSVSGHGSPCSLFPGSSYSLSSWSLSVLATPDQIHANKPQTHCPTSVTTSTTTECSSGSPHPPRWARIFQHTKMAHLTTPESHGGGLRLSSLYLRELSLREIILPCLRQSDERIHTRTWFGEGKKGWTKATDSQLSKEAKSGLHYFLHTQLPPSVIYRSWCCHGGEITLLIQICPIIACIIPLPLTFILAWFVYRQSWDNSDVSLFS